VTLLQQRVGLRNVVSMASNETLLQQRNAALLRQRVRARNGATMADNALDLLAMLRCPAARYNSGQRYTAAFLFFVFCFFTPDNLKREKEWEKERSFDTCSLVSRLRLSQLGWL
jgi:hypothetical protein